MSALLEVNGLTVRFESKRGALTAAESVSFSVPAGGTVGIVGESGSGKSVSVLSLLGLLPGAKISGTATLEGKPLIGASEEELTKLRGDRVAMIFQDPMTSLDPSWRVGDQVAEPLRLHRGLDASAARTRAISLLEAVGLPSPAELARAYPHHLSGGQRQRVMIAAALACEPALLIADEPTTALDVTVQAQVMELLGRLQRERKMGLVLISHDLGLVSEVCEELVVMYAGQVVERGLTKRLLAAPKHPYVAGLLGSTPSLEGEGRLQEIKGTVPDLRVPPPGCRFAERCPRAQPSCSAAPVALTPHEAGGEFRCLFPLEAPRG